MLPYALLLMFVAIVAALAGFYNPEGIADLIAQTLFVLLALLSSFPWSVEGDRGGLTFKTRF
jgi:uncharacterized membrane protein YtjA (UPF0391 family)